MSNGPATWWAKSWSIPFRCCPQTEWHRLLALSPSMSVTDIQPQIHCTFIEFHAVTSDPACVWWDVVSSCPCSWMPLYRMNTWMVFHQYEYAYGRHDWGDAEIPCHKLCIDMGVWSVLFLACPSLVVVEIERTAKTSTGCSISKLMCCCSFDIAW
jgi:hypothetical protein